VSPLAAQSEMRLKRTAPKDGGNVMLYLSTGDAGDGSGHDVYNGVASQPAAVEQSGGLSPYGTMGQSGNVYGWQETACDGVNDFSSELRAIRGGYWDSTAVGMPSSFRSSADPSNPNDYLLGFRVASVPEPSSVAASLLGVGVLMARRRR